MTRDKRRHKQSSICQTSSVSASHTEARSSQHRLCSLRRSVIRAKVTGIVVGRWSVTCRENKLGPKRQQIVSIERKHHPTNGAHVYITNTVICCAPHSYPHICLPACLPACHASVHNVLLSYAYGPCPLSMCFSAWFTPLARSNPTSPKPHVRSHASLTSQVPSGSRCGIPSVVRLR